MYAHQEWELLGLASDTVLLLYLIVESVRISVQKDLDLSLEMKCDLITIIAFSDGEKLLYVETLMKQSA